MDRRAFVAWIFAALVAWVFRRPIPPRPAAAIGGTLEDLIRAKSLGFTQFGHESISEILRRDMEQWQKLQRSMFDDLFETHLEFEVIPRRDTARRAREMGLSTGYLGPRLAGPIGKLPG